MKKFYLFFYLILTGFLSHAQFNKGAILLGGDLNFQASSVKDVNDGLASSTTKNTQVTFQPAIGKAIKEDLVAGITLDYAYSSGSGSTSTKYNLYGGGIFLRKYRSLGNKFYLFGQSNLGYDYSKQTIDNPPNTGGPDHQIDKAYGVGLQFAPGVAYSLDQKWQVEFEFPNLLNINYTHTSEDDLYDTPPNHQVYNNSFGFSSSLSATFTFGLGLRYVIGGK